MKPFKKSDHKESDLARLNDLAAQHGLLFKRAGMVFLFEDYTAYGLDQALGYVEGYDRAAAAHSLVIPPSASAKAGSTHA